MGKNQTEGSDGIDPPYESSERLKLGWDKINFQRTGLKLKNVDGLNWSSELVKSGISTRKYSIPWRTYDTNSGNQRNCKGHGDGNECIDVLFHINDAGARSSSNQWYYQKFSGSRDPNGNKLSKSPGSVNSTTIISIDWSGLSTWGAYEGWKRANPTITAKSIRQKGNSSYWNGRFEFSGFKNPFCFKTSGSEGSSKSVSSGGGCVINSSSSGVKTLSLASNAWVDAHQVGSGAYGITLDSGSVLNLNGKISTSVIRFRRAET